jgi:hypothetical protein
VLLFPVLAGRIVNERWSFAGALEFRRRRQGTSNVHPADLVWLVVAALSAALTAWVVVTLIPQIGRFVSVEWRLLHDAFNHGADVWMIGYFVITTVGAVLMAVIAVGIPWTFMRGSWARTRWGWHGETNEPNLPDEAPAIRELTMRQDHALAVMTVLALLVGVAIVGAALVQWAHVS